MGDILMYIKLNVDNPFLEKNLQQYTKVNRSKSQVIL
jgi:hypothetical protein